MTLLTAFKSSNTLNVHQIFLNSLKVTSTGNMWSVCSLWHPLDYMWISPLYLNLFAKIKCDQKLLWMFDQDPSSHTSLKCRPCTEPWSSYNVSDSLSCTCIFVDFVNCFAFSNCAIVDNILTSFAPHLIQYINMTGYVCPDNLGEKV